LEQLHQCSVCDRPYKSKLVEEKSKHTGLAQQNGFWPSNFAQFVEAGKRAQQVLTPAIDWLDSLICPSGLLLSYYMG
jgi:hypothetical protein